MQTERRLVRETTQIIVKDDFEKLCITLAFREEWHKLQDNSPLKEQCLEFVRV